MKKRISKTCPICRKNFEVAPSRIKYGRGITCSKSCQSLYISKKLSKKIELICVVCNKKFLKSKSQIKNGKGKFCSKDCAYIGRSLGYSKRIVRKPYNCKRKELRICVFCGEKYIYKKKTQKFCSKQCVNLEYKTRYLSENNPSYKNGSSYKKRCWRGNDWEKIRKYIYERDKYTCQECGVKCISKKNAISGVNTDKIIQCHHIENFKIRFNNNFSNLITLCLRCHLKKHNNNDKIINITR